MIAIINDLISLFPFIQRPQIESYTFFLSRNERGSSTKWVLQPRIIPENLVTYVVFYFKYKKKKAFNDKKEI